MVVADTGVWVDAFRGIETPAVAQLRRLLDSHAGVLMFGVIGMEILQGAPNENAAAEIARSFDPIATVSTLESDFDLAADIFRATGRAGRRLRPSYDCLIAAMCIRMDAPLLQGDRDYESIASVSDLRLVRP